MARRPLNIKFNKHSISITFAPDGWDPIYTEMLIAYMRRFERDGSIRGLLPAELLGNALALECLSRDGAVSYRRFMNILEGQKDEKNTSSKPEI